ncbi:MAG: hypothetical protein K6B67_04680 [Lachnospiraceae bacterium]|nr:hypothetical protein [Lachnospiraceae bacterium]
MGLMKGIKMNTIDRNEKIYRFLMLMFVGILIIISVFALSHADIKFIPKWGVELLEHIRTGNVKNYYVDMYNAGEGNNYNLFQTTFVMLCCVPAYIVGKLFHIEVSLLVYQISLKLVVATLHVLCARELHKIINIKFKDENKAFLAGMFYLANPVVIMHGIGIGQIDVLGILLFLLSIRFNLEKKQTKMAVCVGLAILSKFFLLMIYVPVLLLNIKKIKEWTKSIIIVIAIQGVHKLLTSLLFIDAGHQASVHNNEVFIPRLFAVNIDGRTSIFIMMMLLLCGICLAIGLRDKQAKNTNVMMPVLLFWLFLLLVYWHPQWIIYIVPMLIIMVCFLKKEIEIVLYGFGANIGFVLYSMCAFSMSSYSSILIKESMIGRYIPGDENRFLTPWIFERFTENSIFVGGTILMASILLMVIVFWIDTKDNNTNEINELEEIKPSIVRKIIWLVVINAPSYIYIFALYALYIGVI